MRRGLFLLLVASLGAAEPFQLEHRLWLLGGSPPTAADLRLVGVDALVTPVGEASLTSSQVALKLSPQLPLESLRDFPLWALVWVEGDSTNKAAAEALWNQLGPAVRGLPVPAKGVVLAARRWISGLSGMARELGQRSSLPVEVASPAAELASASSLEDLRGLGLVAFALGNLPAEGMPALTPYDAESLLDALDGVGVPLRAAVVLTSRLEPPLPASEALWRLLLNSSLANYQPGAGQDVFVVKGSVGSSLGNIPSGTQVQLLLMDGARLERDLGIALRPVRRNLIGWDSVGIPSPVPTLGLSWEAFLAFSSGSSPEPKPVVRLRWESPTTARLTVENTAPFVSAFGLTGNAVDLTFTGSEVRDVSLLEAVGADFGRREGQFVRTARGAASTVRLYVRAFPPRMAVEVAQVQFVSRPSQLAAYFVARLGDGREISGAAPILE